MSDGGISLAEVGWTIRPYQERFLADGSRLVAVVKARQVGLSEAAALMAVLAALSRRQDLWLLATNLAGATELLRKCLTWLRVMEACSPALAGIVAHESSVCLRLANGSRISALPCTAAAVRGKTGTVIWDEAAHAPADREIWTALAPIIASNPNLRMVLISTPNGDQGVFADAVHGRLDSAGAKWSVHRIDVHTAVREGFSPTVLDLRGAYTADGWAQEFECSFLAVAGRYFPPALVNACLGDPWVRPVVRRVLAIDLASRSDSSVALYVEHHDQGEVTVGHPILLSTAGNPQPYPAQLLKIRELIDHGPEVARVVVDAGGPGAGLAQTLTAEYGRHLILEHLSSASWKAEEIPALKALAESGKLRLAADPSLTLAFGGVREVRSSSNRLLYTLARDEHGHSDAFSATLLGFSEGRPRLSGGKLRSPAQLVAMPPTVVGGSPKKKNSRSKNQPSFASLFGARRS